MKVHQIYKDLSLLVIALAVFAPLLVSSQPPPKGHRGGRPAQSSSARNKKVKRHNLPRPVKPVYHSPPINAFSLKDLQRELDDDFPPSTPLRSPLASRYTSKPPLGGTSGEQRYFASLTKNQFNPNFNPQFFNPTPNFYSGKPQQKPPKGNFGLYGTDFSSISELQGANQNAQFEDYVDEDEGPFGGFGGGGGGSGGGGYKKPYKHHFVPPTTVKPKLLVPSYSSVQVKPANIKHLGSSGYGYPNNEKYGNHEEDYGHKDAHYNFGYEVANHGGHGKEPQYFGHGEQREGDVTKGRYHVLLPDGRHQKVDYTADHSGYHAEVSYTHHGHHGNYGHHAQRY